METRKAKLPDGSLATWHMLFIDTNGCPMALVEMAGGNVRKIPATWIEFQLERRDNENTNPMD